ncbi:MAG: substrate-binding domain-containing protein [Kiritimatiellae bacterium]|nr:substrate-binding domain-containing protein [Kiritimatiellia bacterium]
MNENGAKDPPGPKSMNVGLAVNPAVKPSRDVFLGLVHAIHSRRDCRPLLFSAGSATSPEHLKAFAEDGRLRGMIICGVRRDIVLDFLRLMPDHPPVVLCTYAPLTDEERGMLGYGGEVVLDNESIGIRAADLFLDHGLRNFAFLCSNVYRERIAGKIRGDVFERRVRDALGTDCTFSSHVLGTVKENEDFWELGSGSTEEWVCSLPRPCGILVNGDREAANLLDICNSLGIEVPKHLEVLGINNSFEFCDCSNPTLSSLFPDHADCAKTAVDMLEALIEDRNLPRERRRTMVSTCKLVERGSTSSGREYGHVVARVREFIQKNACSGIRVNDIVKRIGLSRRLLEKRVRDATGQSLLGMIQKVRLANVCRLLATTDLSISEVTVQSGYELTSNLSRLFRNTFGMTMREYRLARGGRN